MSTLHIEPFYDPRTSTLTYVVFDEASRDAVVIDPVLDYNPDNGTTWTESFDQVASYIEREQLRLHYVLETHAHADHLSSSQLFRRTFDAKVAIGERIGEVQATFKPIFDLPVSFATDGRQFDRLLRDGEFVRAGVRGHRDAWPHPRVRHVQDRGRAVHRRRAVHRGLRHRPLRLSSR
jgi:glyoxylase-like metal-dependent hydrolase (beta-lactamase superfamily II)